MVSARNLALSIAIAVAFALSSGAKADYNDNLVAKITQVLTYDGGHFLIALDRMPTGPCSNYFIAPGDIPSDARQMLLSRALIAKNTGEQVNIGFDNKACVNGWFRVHRIG